MIQAGLPFIKLKRQTASIKIIDKTKREMRKCMTNIIAQRNLLHIFTFPLFLYNIRQLRFWGVKRCRLGSGKMYNISN